MNIKKKLKPLTGFIEVVNAFYVHICVSIVVYMYDLDMLKSIFICNEYTYTITHK